VGSNEKSARCHTQKNQKLLVVVAWWGTKKGMSTKKNIKKDVILSKMKNFDVCSISQKHIVFRCHFWKYKPPGGLPETNPGFSETQISAQSRV